MHIIWNSRGCWRNCTKNIWFESGLGILSSEFFTCDPLIWLKVKSLSSTSSILREGKISRKFQVSIHFFFSKHQNESLEYWFWESEWFWKPQWPQWPQQPIWPQKIKTPCTLHTNWIPWHQEPHQPLRPQQPQWPLQPIKKLAELDDAINPGTKMAFFGLLIWNILSIFTTL